MIDLKPYNISLKLNVKILLFLFLFSLAPTTIIAQYGTKAQVSNINFELINEKVIITYDLVNARPGDLFNIKVDIYNSAGYRIEAQSIEGEFANVKRGRQKQIIWYISEDYTNFEDNIYVELTALHTNYKPINRVSRIEALAKSTLYPGWGSSQITLNKSNYIKGAFGYAFLASSIYIFETSVNSGSSVNSFEEDLFQGMGYTFLGAAGLIWVWEYGKILFTPNISKKIKLDIEACNYNQKFVPLLSLKFTL
ncbi:MAG: hypothetical protein JXB17_13755 [Bacteroidales bacterium]|nr:hypothetical protein [Bacteroidales bacterium]